MDIDSLARKIPKEKSFSTRRMLKFELDQAYLLKYSKRGILLFYARMNLYPHVLCGIKNNSQLSI